MYFFFNFETMVKNYILDLLIVCLHVLGIHWTNINVVTVCGNLTLCYNMKCILNVKTSSIPR